MKAAIVNEAGAAPVYGEFRNPEAAAGKSLIRVTASSLSHVTRSRASGAHYRSDGELPFVPGIDGTGVREDGRRVYLLLAEKPFGAMAEWCLVDDRHQLSIPDGLDDAAAAAMAIPGMSSWAALMERAKLVAGETVLVNGAAGASGRLAIQIAKHLGAKKVIASARRIASFDELGALGADVVVPLLEDRDALESAFKDQFRQGIDVVLDYVYGVSAQTLIVAAAKAGADGVPIRYVQIGSMGGTEISLPSAALRSSALQLMGSGIGSVPFPQLLDAIRGVLDAAQVAGLKIATEEMPLSEVSKAWNATDVGARIVLIP